VEVKYWPGLPMGGECVSSVLGGDETVDKVPCPSMSQISRRRPVRPTGVCTIVWCGVLCRRPLRRTDPHGGLDTRRCGYRQVDLSDKRRQWPKGSSERLRLKTTRTTTRSLRSGSTNPAPDKAGLGSSTTVPVERRVAVDRTRAFGVLRGALPGRRSALERQDGPGVSKHEPRSTLFAGAACLARQANLTVRQDFTFSSS
jgi:hypothetical protein